MKFSDVFLGMLLGILDERQLLFPLTTTIITGF